MKKSIIKETIRDQLEGRILLNEGPLNAIKRGAAGIQNAASAGMGQMRLGHVNKRLEQTADKIQDTWDISSDAISDKIRKMFKASNPQVKRMGQSVLQNKQAIDNDIDSAVAKIKQISTSGADQAGGDRSNMSDLEKAIAPKQVSDEFGNQYTEYGVDRWLNRLGIDAQGSGKTLKNHLSKLFLDLVSKNLNPLTMPIEKQMPIVNYAKALHMQLQRGTLTPIQFDKKLKKVVAKYVSDGKMPEELSNEEGVMSVGGGKGSKKTKLLKQAEKNLFKKLKSGELDPESFQKQMAKLKEIMAGEQTAEKEIKSPPVKSNIPANMQDLIVQSLMKKAEESAAAHNFALDAEKKKNILDQIRKVVADVSTKIQPGDIKGAAKLAKDQLKQILAPSAPPPPPPAGAAAPPPPPGAAVPPPAGPGAPPLPTGNKFKASIQNPEKGKKKSPAPLTPPGSPQYGKSTPGVPPSQAQPQTQPIPLTKLKQGNVPNPGLPLPPEEVGPPRKLLSQFMEPQLNPPKKKKQPSSKSMEPSLLMPQGLQKKTPGPLPVEDTGEEIQVGDEQTPGFGPGAAPPKPKEKKSKKKSSSKSK